MIRLPATLAASPRCCSSGAHTWHACVRLPTSPAGRALHAGCVPAALRRAGAQVRPCLPRAGQQLLAPARARMPLLALPVTLSPVPHVRGAVPTLARTVPRPAPPCSNVLAKNLGREAVSDGVPCSKAEAKSTGCHNQAACC